MNSELLGIAFWAALSLSIGWTLFFIAKFLRDTRDVELPPKEDKVLDLTAARRRNGK